MYEKYIKRLLDIICAVLALVCFSWLYIIIAALVRIKLGSPVIFSQERPGKDEKIFKLYKFRTMTDKRNENGELLPDEMRLTKLGKFLRAASLDELPEAWNILLGDMSVVGPRPLMVEYLSYYTEEEKKRHRVRPGLTGKAQVEGRNLFTWEEKLSCDLQYIENISFATDIRLIFATVGKFLKKSGVISGDAVHLPDGRVVRPLNIERQEKAEPLNVQ